jgi:Ribbon-helix-helix protein, copG family
MLTQAVIMLAMVRTQVQLTEAQMEDLRRISAASGESIADLVRQAVDRLLATQSSAAREERIKRAMRVAGRFRSGKPDGSARHDDHLSAAIHDDLR